MKEVKLKVSNRQLEALSFGVGMYWDMTKETLERMYKKPQDFAISTLNISQQRKNQREYVRDIGIMWKKLNYQRKKLIKK